jgi:hypothetical protein
VAQVGQAEAALRLEAVDAMLHLCRHAVVQHRAHLGLRPLCDLAQVVHGWGSGEWEELARRAVAYGLARPVYTKRRLNFPMRATG